MELKIFIARGIHKIIQHTELMTENMRSPKTIGLAWVARTLMNYSNARVSIDIVNRMKLKKTDYVLELGVGNGLAIKEIAKISGNNIIGIEISAEFRRNLLKMKLPKNIVIIENDAKDLSNEIPDGQIDKILAINVIYFLKPLREYIIEFKRILKKGGIGYLGCKFESIKNFDIEVAPNRNEKEIIRQLSSVGFDVSSEFVDLGEDRSRYTFIRFEK
ncbi:class I SAM-dependent methyltransferase [Paracoccaceae bacterium]|nr:class I SAM-dependent methyltransferase [Paracoccaceae bacterium]